MEQSVKKLDRLLFIQGGRCFFCRKPLPKEEASIEHIVAKANGGKDDDSNCVVCCKKLNLFLGSLPLKEKIRVILDHNGKLKCPSDNRTDPDDNGNAADGNNETSQDNDGGVEGSKNNDVWGSVVEKFAIQRLARLQTKPGKLDTLRTTVAFFFHGVLSEEEIDFLIKKLMASGKIAVDGDKIVYRL